MAQRAIPFTFMRGGTSRAVVFHRHDLPEDEATLSEVLIAVLGSGHPLNIDGLGGGAAVTTKVAMLSPSKIEGADVDYFFAQVSVSDKLVDYKPTCGNILTAVGSAAIEMGLVKPSADITKVNVYATNTKAMVEQIIETPNFEINYQGNMKIDGVPGSSAPIALNFKNVTGSVTGALLPTGNLRDMIDGIEVTCLDVAMPMVIAKASDFGLTGYETAEALDENKDFFKRMEAVRIKAGALMGLGDVHKSVIPKFGLLAKAKAGGSISARYFMPWNCHPSIAVTGSQCLAACALISGAVADGLLTKSYSSPATLQIEHPSGQIEVVVNYQKSQQGINVESVGMVRTARKIASGEVFIPAGIWP